MVQNLHSTRTARAKHKNNPRSRLHSQMLPSVNAQRCNPTTEVNRLQRKVHSRTVSNPQHQSLHENIRLQKTWGKTNSSGSRGIKSRLHFTLVARHPNSKAITEKVLPDAAPCETVEMPRAERRPLQREAKEVMVTD